MLELGLLGGSEQGDHSRISQRVSRAKPRTQEGLQVLCLSLARCDRSCSVSLTRSLSQALGSH